jgi:hypothetical protein
MLGFRAPEAVAQLLKTRRAAFIQGPVNMPFSELPDAPVDLVTPDWQVIAERIVSDLATQSVFKGNEPVVFEAKLQRVPLSQYAHDIS